MEVGLGERGCSDLDVVGLCRLVGRVCKPRCTEAAAVLAPKERGWISEVGEPSGCVHCWYPASVFD